MLQSYLTAENLLQYKMRCFTVIFTRVYHTMYRYKQSFIIFNPTFILICRMFLVLLIFEHTVYNVTTVQ